MTDTTQQQPAAQPPADQYEAQAQHFFRTWAEKLRELAATKAQLEHVRGDLNQAEAAIAEKQIYNTQLEGQLRASQAREAKALEDIGVLKGIMQTHGASIADVVSRIGEPVPVAPTVNRTRTDPQ